MTSEQKQRIESLRAQGLGYKKISIETGIPEGTLKSYFRRTTDPMPVVAPKPVSPADDQDTKPCQFCGTPVVQNPGRKEKKFCSAECRNRWWNRNKYKVPRKAYHTFLCPTCGEEFSVYGTSGRKYCSHACYIAGRFRGGAL
jgi:hypothetical protein